MRLILYNLFCFIVNLLIANNACALPDDRNQPMLLSAQTADLDQETHQGNYLGEVTLDQGTTHLRAAKAMTQANINNQLILALAHGNTNAQAHYWTITASDKPILHAYADTISYDPIHHRIELIGHASVKQGNNSFSAPKISYDIDKQHVVSTSDEKSRTTIIIYPEKHR